MIFVVVVFAGVLLLQVWTRLVVLISIMGFDWLWLIVLYTSFSLGAGLFVFACDGLLVWVWSFCDLFAIFGIRFWELPVEVRVVSVWFVFGLFVVFMLWVALVARCFGFVIWVWLFVICWLWG